MKLGAFGVLVAAAAMCLPLTAAGTSGRGPSSAATPFTGAIVFASDRDGDVDIYVVGARSGAPRHLTRNNDRDQIEGGEGTFAREFRGEVFVLRADGVWRRLAAGTLYGVYDRGRRVVIEGANGLIVARSDGTRRWPVRRPTYPDVAPDARHVAYVLRDERPGLIVVDVETGKSRRIVTGDDVRSTWAPDGSRLLVELQTRRGTDVYVAGIRPARPARRIAREYLGLATWSPDSRRIAFRSPSSPETVAVVDAATGQRWVVPMGGNDVGYPAWSHNGARLAYLVKNYEGDDAVVVADPRARRARVLARGQYLDDLKWSPDGRRLAFEAETDAAPRSIVVVEAAAGEPRTLLQGDARFGGWHPDSRRLLFARAGRVGVVGVDARIRGTSPAPFAVPDSYQLVWSPRRDAVAFETGHGGRSVFVLSADGRRLRRLTHRGTDRIVGWTARLPRGTAPEAVLASERSARRVLDARGVVAGIASDASRVAVLVEPWELDCSHAVVWEPGRKLTRIGTPAPCTSDGEWYPLDITFEGDVVTWSRYTCGSSSCETIGFRAPARATDAVAFLDLGYSDGAPQAPPPAVETRRGVTMRVAGGVVVLRREVDGRERVVRAARPIFDAELEDHGLYYAFNRPRGEFKGRVVFVPFDELLAS